MLLQISVSEAGKYINQIYFGTASIIIDGSLPFSSTRENECKLKIVIVIRKPLTRVLSPLGKYR